MAEEERTREDDREPEGHSPEDEQNRQDEPTDEEGSGGSGESSDSGDSGSGDSDDSGGSTKSEKFDEDAPGGASVPASGVGDWEAPHKSEDPSKFSDTDAMGQDKRRQIIGQGYGPSKMRQFLYYGIFLAFVAALAFGATIAVDKLDKPPPEQDKAPWTGNQVPAKQFE